MPMYPNPAKSYWFNIDNMDYNRKETVVRPILEVNVKLPIGSVSKEKAI